MGYSMESIELRTRSVNNSIVVTWRGAIPIGRRDILSMLRKRIDINKIKIKTLPQSLEVTSIIKGSKSR